MQLMIPAHITNAPAHVRGLHDHYCARSGFPIMYNMVRENVWKDWLQFCDWQWGKDEISRVVFYIRSEIKRQKRNEGALRFSNLIGDPMKFEEDLGFALKDGETCAAFRKPSRPAASPTTASTPKPTEEPPVEGAGYFLSQLKKPPHPNQ